MNRCLTAIFVALALLSGLSAHAQTKVIKGRSQYGEVLYNFDGEYLRAGTSVYSEVLFNWDGEFIRMGESHYSDPLYNFDGQYLRSGRSRYSTELLNISGKLPVALLIFLLM